MSRPLLLEWRADSRRLRFEKLHASRRLEEILEKEGVLDCTWVWESRGNQNRLCLSCERSDEPVCEELSTELLRDAAKNDPESEAALQRSISSLVRRVRVQADPGS